MCWTTHVVCDSSHSFFLQEAVIIRTVRPALHPHPIPPPPTLLLLLLLLPTGSQTSTPAQSPRVRPGGWSEGEQQDSEQPGPPCRSFFLIGSAVRYRRRRRGEWDTGVCESGLRVVGTLKDHPTCFQVPFSRQSHVFTADTMGCCSGRCTLIFICTLQLVSGAVLVYLVFWFVCFTSFRENRFTSLTCLNEFCLKKKKLQLHVLMKSVVQVLLAAEPHVKKWNRTSYRDVTETSLTCPTKKKSYLISMI